MGEVSQITITDDNQEEISAAVAQAAAEHNGTPPAEPEATDETAPDETEEAPKVVEEQSLKITKEEEAEEEEAKVEETEADPDAFNLEPLYEEFAETGTLSDESKADIVARLTKAGFSNPESLVEQHMAGSVASTQNLAAQVETVRSQAFEIAGGQDQYGEMMQWAQENLSPAEIAAYDQAVENPALVPLAVRGIHAQYTGATGQNVQANVPTPAARVESVATSVAGSAPVTSLKEVSEITADPRFGTNPGWTAEQEARIQRSIDRGLL